MDLCSLATQQWNLLLRGKCYDVRLHPWRLFLRCDPGCVPFQVSLCSCPFSKPGASALEQVLPNILPVNSHSTWVNLNEFLLFSTKNPDWYIAQPLNWAEIPYVLPLADGQIAMNISSCREPPIAQGQLFLCWVIVGITKRFPSLRWNMPPFSSYPLLHWSLG